MSLILKVTHSFTRTTDKKESLIQSVAYGLKLTPLHTMIWKEIAMTPSGKACRNVDLAKKFGCNENIVCYVKNILNKAGVINLGHEWIVVDWVQVREIASRKSAKKVMAKASPSHAAKVEKNLSAEAIKSLVAAEVKAQMQAMAQRMIGQ